MSDSDLPPEAKKSAVPAEMPDGDLPMRNESQAPKNAQNSPSSARNDSFNVPVKKNVIMIWSLLNVALVTFMVILFYVLYQSRQN